jgi:hypothetical protein
MENIHYPSLYQAANSASIKYQKTFTILMGINLAMMITGALLSILKLQFSNTSIVIYVISTIMIVAGLIITLVLKYKKFEDVWYQGRALAESVKTLTWRFISCSEGFEVNKSMDESKKHFLEKIEELQTQFKAYTQHYDSKTLLLSNVSEAMVMLRSKSLDERKKYYSKKRIEDQKNWYSTKAEYNRKKQNFWFIIILISQFLAFCASLFLILNPCSTWNLVGLFTTIASVGVAWNQLKQHQDHKQAYITAAFELQLINEKAGSIKLEDEFSKYVLDSENAISREHTLWLVQKRK